MGGLPRLGPRKDASPHYRRLCRYVKYSKQTQKATAPYGPLWEVGNSYCRSESTVIAAVRRQQLLPQFARADNDLDTRFFVPACVAFRSD